MENDWIEVIVVVIAMAATIMAGQRCVQRDVADLRECMARLESPFEGIMLIVNYDGRHGSVKMQARDDSGTLADPVSLELQGHQAAHFNADDLEDGNPEKVLVGKTGARGTVIEAQYRYRNGPSGSTGLPGNRSPSGAATI